MLLTGASSGIGRELALVLAARGARLAIAARGASGWRRSPTRSRDGGAPPVVLAADLSQRGAAARARGRGARRARRRRRPRQQRRRRRRRVAVGGRRRATRRARRSRSTTGARWRSSARSSRRCASAAAARSSTSRRWRRSTPGRCFGAYAATKAALALATETLRLELLGHRRPRARGDPRPGRHGGPGRDAARRRASTGCSTACRSATRARDGAPDRRARSSAAATHVIYPRRAALATRSRRSPAGTPAASPRGRSARPTRR